MSWDELCRRYLAIRGAQAWEKESPDLIRDTAIAVQELSTSDVVWLASAIEDPGRKWFAAFALGRTRAVPEALWEPLLDAAVDEPDPSFNRAFVEPCLDSAGARWVMERLLGIIEHGSNVRKRGAFNAWYWAAPGLSFVGWKPGATVDDATPESRAAWLAVDDLRARYREAALREFVTNDDLDLRRVTARLISEFADGLPPELEPLWAQAIHIGSTHPDGFIRHQFVPKPGEENLLFALPEPGAPPQS